MDYTTNQPPSSSQHHLHTTNNLDEGNKDTTTTTFFNSLLTTTTTGGDDVGRRSTTSAATPRRPPPPADEETGRERLKRHRFEMAGRVWIPDIWGQEDLLQDWIDCTVFDSSLGNNTIISARTALVQEARSTLRIENRC